MGSLDKPFRTGRTSAKRAQQEQQEAIAKQRQADELALAEEESEMEKKKQMARSGQAGRSLLIKTGETGTKSTNLGGTT